MEKQKDKFEKFSLWKSFLYKENTDKTIVLNKHFLFIQIPKTSSTNVLKESTKRKLITKMNCYRHEGLAYLENYIDKNLPVYAIVRNPFSHIHSYFFHRLRHKELILDDKLSIIQNFENFVKKNIDNIHIKQCVYLKSNKNIKVKTFKIEDNDFNDYLIKHHNIDLKLNENNHNKNSIKDKYDIKIQDFYQNKEIVNLILKERKMEFEMFKYSKNINDI